MIVVHFDGFCQPNPGVGTYGFVVHRDGKKIHEEGELVGRDTTNNVAEYTGALRAVEWLIAKNLASEPVIVRGDSKLVIEQVSGRWKVKDSGLAPFVVKIKELFFKFKSLTFEWVPREQNGEADRLTGLAYARFRAGRESR